MINPIFLGVDLAIPTYSWSEGTNASYPLTNLKDYYPDHKSRSNGLTDNQTFDMDFGAAVSMNYLIIQGCNFDSLGAGSSVTLQYFSGTWQAVPISLSTPANDSTARTLSFGATSAQLWRLIFVRGSALAVAPEIGNIFLGTKLQFETTPDWGGHTNVPKSKTDVKESLDGRTDTTELYIKRKHRIIFSQNNLQSDSFVTSYLAFLALVDNNCRPFYYIDNLENVYLVNLVEDEHPYEQFRYNRNKLGTLNLISTMGE